MQKVTIKIPRNKQKLRIIRSQDVLNRQVDERLRIEEEERLKSLFVPEPEPDEVEIEHKPKRAQYTEYFTISNYNQPIQISLKNIPPESITVGEAQIEIQRAYDEGYNDGKETTDSEYKAEILKYEDWIRKIDSVVLEIKDKYLKEIKVFEDIIVSTSVMIASEILKRDISKDSEIVIDQVKAAISAIEDEVILSIHLNPAEVEIIEQAKSVLTDDKKKLENVKIVPNKSVERGGCILKSNAGNIDARIAIQLANISAILKKSILDDDEIAQHNFHEQAIELGEQSMKMVDQIISSEKHNPSEDANESEE